MGHFSQHRYSDFNVDYQREHGDNSSTYSQGSTPSLLSFRYQHRLGDSNWTTSSSKAQDVEASVTGDPLNFKNGTRSDSELAELRRRKNKTDVVKYLNRQNDVRASRRPG